jgi:hypothetical protein
LQLRTPEIIADSAFTIIPETCSGSPWNSVRNHPGIAFTFGRFPHSVARRASYRLTTGILSFAIGLSRSAFPNRAT